MTFKYQSQSRINFSSPFPKGRRREKKNTSLRFPHRGNNIVFLRYRNPSFPRRFSFPSAVRSVFRHRIEQRRGIRERERERDLAGRCIQIWIVDVATSRRRIEKWGRAASIFEHRIFYTFALSLSLFCCIEREGEERNVKFTFRR